jgi:hypothetical protein
LLFFDLESKNSAIILVGPVVDAPTVIFVPAAYHYPTGFEVRSSTPLSSVTWDDRNQLLYWYPAKTLDPNYIIISQIGRFNPRVLPEQAKQVISDQTSLFTIERHQSQTEPPQPCRSGPVAK